MKRNGRILFKQEEKFGMYVIPEEFRNDKEIILAALKSDRPCSFNDIPQCFREDKEFVLSALTHSNTNIFWKQYLGAYAYVFTRNIS